MKNLLVSLTLILGGFITTVSAQDIESYLKQAHEAREQMDFENASKLYTKVIELDTNNIEALYYRGWVENFWNKSKGFEDFKRVLELDSLHEGALHSMAEYYSFKGEKELADEYKMKAIVLNPKTASNTFTLARKAYTDGKYEDAIEHCNESIELEDESQIWMQLVLRAKAYHMLGKNKGTITDFERCFNEFGYGMYRVPNFDKTFN